MSTFKAKRRQKVKWRIRKKVQGTAETPRLSVFRSNKGIYAQLIDDVNGVTLASASSKELGLTSVSVENSKKVGEGLAKKAVDNGVSSCVFDRSGYLYHGNVKALADGAREGGLKF
ncbi:50S ribosomal protein L18 [Jiulongibacter sediminis]|uniref:Large ribosomal subunit protein uL18 n=1 Tax=Jiulongibacter sediminis TaxID=1605367 RepID=A0A0P7BZJ9_9BACT|nr:50S ribosomal protein L18 [Jiulongibacter sediminis]KPM49871.1 50S ribosomal protein L18 [Jiulongibacter sediminis]TBX26907.1 50S ribosomal protein L18 [Jiulongibacter sediminis]